MLLLLLLLISSVLGGVSIDFTDSRFKDFEDSGPGPTDYRIEEDLLKCHKRRPHPGTWRGPAGKLCLGRPPRSILPAALSVPGKYDTGYHVNRYGVFVKNSRVAHEPTFFYNVPRGETNTTTRMYKGNFWSRMSGRKEPQRFLTPAPGDYEHEKKKSVWQLHDEKVRETRRKSSRQLRTLDIMYRRLIRENLPAPNSYRVKGCFDKYFKIPCKCDPYALEPPPFGTTAKRFDDKEQSVVPSPGTYNPQDQTKCVASILLAPFGSYASRYQRKVEDTEPSPSDYHTNVGNLAYESEKRFKYNYVQPWPSIAFKQTYLSDDEYNCEVPDFARKNSVKKRAIYHAAFKSRTSRFPKEKTDVPDPGAYEVLSAFKANRDRCEVLSHPAPFGSRVSRFPKKYRNKEYTPDPTCYEVRGDIATGVKGGVMSSTSWKEEKPRAPPASRYNIHPYVSSSILKKSFNVTLGKPKVIEEMTKIEKPVKRIRCPCAKKKLRWFAVPPKEYDHCQTVSI